VDKKTIIMLVPLVLVIIFYWQILEFLGFVKPKPAAPMKVGTESTQVVVDTAKPPVAATTPAAAPVTLDTATSAPAVALDTIRPETLTVRTKAYTVVMSSKGGGPVSLKLNGYTLRNGTPIEMLPGKDPVVTPEVTFAGGTVSSSTLPYRCNLPPGSYDATSRQLEIAYTYTSPTGGTLIRHFTFHPDSNHYELVIEVSNREKLGLERQYSLNWNSPLGVTEPNPRTDYEAMEAVAMMAGSREHFTDFKDNKLNESKTGTTIWAGVRSKYFAAVLIPRSRVSDGATATGTERSRDNVEFGKYLEKEVSIGLELPIGPEPQFADSFTVYVGPLDYMGMREYGVELQDLLGIGTMPYVGWIIKPFAIAMIWLLPRIHSVIPNYGWVIIIFAILVKLITLPLSLKSMKSMNATKELQPKIEELKKRLKNRPQDLNAETMRLYKEHGVNPLSGCLPMLAQMPLFFALFPVFNSTILFRNAPFMFFINDLSQGANGILDPHLILVVLMVIFQFISQKLSMAGNQQNKMMMYILPLVFAFFFWRLPSGIVLYWTMFSLLSIGDYFMFRRKQKNLEVKTI
jgi:YidC/Oxa1 family membrane protein insertase